jgi:hypothetical protein
MKNGDLSVMPMVVFYQWVDFRPHGAVMVKFAMRTAVQSMEFFQKGLWAKGRVSSRFFVQ